MEQKSDFIESNNGEAVQKRANVSYEIQPEYGPLMNKLEQQLKHNSEIDNFKYSLTKISSVEFLNFVIENLIIRLSYSNIEQYTECIKPILIAYKTNQQNYRTRLVEIFSSYLHLRLDAENALKSHNVCVLMIIMLQELPDFVEQLSPQPVYTFLMHNLINVKTFFNDPQRMINLFVVIDRMKLSEQHKIELLNREPSVLATLWWCADLYGRSDCVTRLAYQPNNVQINFMHLQVGFCARWFLERILLGQTVSNSSSNQAALNRQDKSKHLKLSPDCLSARSDWKWQYVRSTRAVDSGVYYYEVVLNTGGPMRIGWTYTTSKRTSLVLDKVKEEIFTIVLNGHDECVYRKERKRSDPEAVEQKLPVKLKSRWSPGDVVGCLINFRKFKFDFFLNGKLIQLQDVYKYIPEGKQSFHASISLYEHQQCYCNFGQTNFKYPPKDVKFECFYNGDHIINDHTESKSEPKWYEFKDDVLMYDRVERLFEKDEMQTQTDELVKQIEQNIFSKLPLVIDLSKEYECLRIIQSIVDRTGTLLDSCLDLLINWTDQMIRHLAINVNTHFPDFVCQVLYPYFQLHLTSDTIITHRNVCAMLCILGSVITDLDIRANLHKQIITYLYKLVAKYCDYAITNDNHQADDEWTLMFAIVALGNLRLTDETKKMIKDNAKVCKILEAQSYTTYVDNVSNYKPQEGISKYLLLQSQFCTQWFLDKVLMKTEGTSCSTEDNVISVEKPTKLSSTNCSLKVKLSQDRLTARSDSNWQSVRSNCCTKESIYYEVTLHTNGPIRIGWATGQTNLNQSQIGMDRHSIGYDGFNRLVWHNDVAYPVMQNAPQWAAGDIVGCLISRGKFAFFLNERAIEFPKMIHYSSRPYFAAASLSTQQQCGFNFSKTIYHARRSSSRNFDSVQRIKLHNFYIRVRKRLMYVNGIFAGGNAHLQFHRDFQMIYQEANSSHSNEQTSCGTGQSTKSANNKKSVFSSIENEQMFSDIMEEEIEENEKVDDDEIQGEINKMFNNESEA